LVFITVPAIAQDIFVPPTGYQPPKKADDILPIAPMRLDDRAETPPQVFTSVEKNDEWEIYERGELKNDKRTVYIADKKKKGKGKVARGKKVDSKKKVANLKKRKSKVSKKAVAEKSRSKAKLNAKKQTKSRKPASKKSSRKRKKK